MLKPTRLILLCLLLFVYTVISWGGVAAATIDVKVQMGNEAAALPALTDADFEAIGIGERYYSSCDQSGRPGAVAVRGVSFSNLFRYLHIAGDDVESVSFQTSDAMRRTFSRSQLLGAAGYHYPHLASHYDAASASFVEGYDEGKEPAIAMLYLQSYFETGNTTPDYDNLHSGDSPGVSLGQSDPSEKTYADKYAKRVSSMTITLREGANYDFTGNGNHSDPTGLPEPVESSKSGTPSGQVRISVFHYGDTPESAVVTKTFTIADLEAMGTVTQAYTYIDKGPCFVISQARGVPIGRLLYEGNIDVNSVQTVYFFATDGSKYHTSWPKNALIDTERHYYPNIPGNWDMDSQTIKDQTAASAGGQVVDAILALESNWWRWAKAPVPEMHTESALHLVFGQASVADAGSYRSTTWVTDIKVQLGGTPPKNITMNRENITGLLGSVHQLAVTFEGDVNVDKYLHWKSSNPEVATVDQQGNVTIHKEGTATISATNSLGQTVKATVVGKKEVEETETPSSPAGGTTDPTDNTPSSSSSGSTDGGAKTQGNPAAPGAMREISLANIAKPQDLQGAVNPEHMDNDTGGVQNWRAYEMSAVATELAEIQADNNAVLFVKILAAAILIGGGALRTRRYLREV